MYILLIWNVKHKNIFTKQFYDNYLQYRKKCKIYSSPRISILQGSARSHPRVMVLSLLVTTTYSPLFSLLDVGTVLISK